ncbi:MAG: MBL fold metallo-hydrolase [Thermoanaerobaculia bacterium]
MLVASLGSGSGGNSCLFEADGTRILVDAGFGLRQTQQRLRILGRELTDIHAIVITHEHGDHVHGAVKIAAKFEIPIYATRGTLVAAGLDPAEIPARIFENNTSFRIGELEVHARRIIHDASDPSCFVIEAGDGTRAGIASDLGVVDGPVLEHLRGCDALLFEANHDLDMLRSGNYPWSLKRRILSRHGHLSNEDSMDALARIVGEGTRHLCLIHLSERNNHESIVRAHAEELRGKVGAELALTVAGQHAPMAPIEVTRRSGKGQMRLF